MPATDSCLRCGLCLPVCPTYNAHPVEPLSPRGRVALARGLVCNELQPTPTLLSYIDSCLDCIACVAVCPSGVPVSDAVSRARELLRAEMPPPLLQQLVLRHALPFPDRQKWAYPLLRILPHRPYSLSALPTITRPLRPSLTQEMAPYGQSRAYRVGYFVGCGQDLLFSQASRATIEVLRYNGCQVVTFPAQVCCGKPFTSYGQPEGARGLARRNISAIETAGLDALVTDCATCGSFLKAYPELFSDEQEWADRASSLASKVMEVSQFLVNVPLRKGQTETRLRVTYHIPCHLGRGLGGGEEAHQVLRAIPGIEVADMAEADSCCGGAGNYLLRHPRLSHRILERKVSHIAAAEASAVATSCPGCRLHLLYGLRRHGVHAQVLYPQELLLRSYQDRG
ncbi:MAG: (Fe-S)-binding protein [Dehalococcoidia bacterium]|nr:(Fe-S)-binding protein [Dehalococcoidia bacterium]